MLPDYITSNPLNVYPCLFISNLHFFFVSNWKCFKAGFISKLVIWSHRLHFLSEKLIFEKLNSAVTFLVWRKCHKSSSISCGYPDTTCARMSERKSLRSQATAPNPQPLHHITERCPLIQTTTPTMYQCLTCITSPSVWFPNRTRSVYSTIVSHTYTPTCARINQDEDGCHTHQTECTQRMPRSTWMQHLTLD